LIVFGNQLGIEDLVDNEEQIKIMSKDLEKVFDKVLRIKNRFGTYHLRIEVRDAF
jgi:hypothetical protein